MKHSHLLKIFGSDLKGYQTEIIKYFKKSKYDVLLMYLTVGCGKTLTSLAYAVDALDLNLCDEIVVLSPKSVQDEFMQNLELLNTFRKINEEYHEHIHLIAYNGNNSQVYFRKLINIHKKYLFIIDELHLFMRGVIKVNLKEDEKVRNIGNCKNIFEIIKQIKHKKVLGLTGTPSVKFPFELIPFFNLAGEIFPETVESFEDMYIDKDKNKLKNVAELKKKLKGLVVYHELKTSLKTSELIEVEIEMSELMYKKYLIDYYLELHEKSFITSRNVYRVGYGMKSTFHAKTFQDSIYIPKLKKKIINELIYKVFDDSLTKTNTKLIKLNEDENIKIDSEHCPKLLQMYEDTKQIKGLCVFYFKFVKSGVNIMEEVLRVKGFNKFGESSKDFKTFATFTGDESEDLKTKIKTIFNSYENRQGKIIKYLILSSCGAVGITLKNVRYLGIGSVEFNYSMIRQIMGRVNRLGSHDNLELKDRTLIQKIYLSVKNTKYYSEHKKEISKLCSRDTYEYKGIKGLCIERIIYQDSIYDDFINEEFRKILKDVSMI